MPNRGEEEEEYEVDENALTRVITKREPEEEEEEEETRGRRKERRGTRGRRGRPTR